MRNVFKWSLAYFAAVAVSATFLWVAFSLENWYFNFSRGIVSEYDDIHTITYWIDGSKWLLLYAIYITILAAPFAIGFSLFFERLGKRPHLLVYILVGAVAGFAGITLMAGTPNFAYETLWEYFQRIYLWLVAGALGGIIFGLLRKL